MVMIKLSNNRKASKDIWTAKRLLDDLNAKLRKSGLPEAKIAKQNKSEIPSKKVWTHKEFGEKLNEEFQKRGLSEVKEVGRPQHTNEINVISIRKKDPKNRSK